ncbi:hypothetical protein R1sor_025915 [Riccia sorocarpa]|uniref:LOV domain-containing protein n=1 Tax=Riccia sorocarpa TaxID=122646 RepID=A0ABD3GCP6_9MARC
MPTNNGRNPFQAFHKKLMSPKPFDNRSTMAASNIDRPAPLPRVPFARDSRGSLEIFGASGVQEGDGTPVFSSPAWKLALETAESLLLKDDSPFRPASPFGDESDVSQSSERSALWRTESRSRLPAIPRPPSTKPKSTSAIISPASLSLEYVASDNDLSPGDVKRAIPGSESSGSWPRKVPLNPHKSQPVVAVYEEPEDMEEKWRSMLSATSQASRREERVTAEGGNANWQAVLAMGGAVRDCDVENDRRKSLGASSVYSEDVRSERAQQWGYEVPVRTSNEFGDGSSILSRRTSTVSSESRSSGGSTSSQNIPKVSKDVRDAITSFNLAFVVCDATATEPTYPVLYASGGFFKMFGYEADEVIGHNCRFLQGPRTDPKEVAKIRRALKRGSTYSGKILNYRKDGTSFLNVLSISPIKDNAGKVIKYIGMQAEASEKEEEKATLPEVITETARPVPGPKPVNFPKPPKPVNTSNTEAFIPQFSLPPPLKGSIDTLPRSSYRYSLSNSRQSNESVADWQALARLRAEIVSTAQAPPESPKATVSQNEPVQKAEEKKVKEKEKEKKEKNVKSITTPRAKGVTRLFRKLNSKISGRLKSSDIEYVDCDNEDQTPSIADESEGGRRRRSSMYSKPSADFRLASPSDLTTADIPERGERLSSSHCVAPAVTHKGLNQFVIIH